MREGLRHAAVADYEAGAQVLPSCVFDLFGRVEILGERGLRESFELGFKGDFGSRFESEVTQDAMNMMGCGCGEPFPCEEGTTWKGLIPLI